MRRLLGGFGGVQKTEATICSFTDPSKTTAAELITARLTAALATDRDPTACNRPASRYPDTTRFDGNTQASEPTTGEGPDADAGDPNEQHRATAPQQQLANTCRRHPQRRGAGRGSVAARARFGQRLARVPVLAKDGETSRLGPAQVADAERRLEERPPQSLAAKRGVRRPASRRRGRPLRPRGVERRSKATQFKPPRPPILRRRGLVGASGGPSCSYKYIMLSILRLGVMERASEDHAETAALSAGFARAARARG